MSQKVRSVWLGISIGALISILFGLVYLVVLHEPSSAFYLFTGLVFLAGPLIGGIVTMMNAREHRRNAFFTSSSSIFGILWMLFILTYLVFPLFDRASVKLPDVCDRNHGALIRLLVLLTRCLTHKPGYC